MFSIRYGRRRWLRANLLALIAFGSLIYYFFFFTGDSKLDLGTIQALSGTTGHENQKLNTGGATDDNENIHPQMPRLPFSTEKASSQPEKKLPAPHLGGYGRKHIPFEAPVAVDDSDKSSLELVGMTSTSEDSKSHGGNSQSSASLDTNLSGTDEYPFEMITAGGGASRLNPLLKGATKRILTAPKFLPRNEKYPVPENQKISLKYHPEQVKSFPKIQSDRLSTSQESTNSINLQRRLIVKKAFITSWNQYKQYAWGHDEINPVSNTSADPFLGWAATLVDALDTLQIMGLHDEYKEAIGMVSNIDFSTTFRKDIPLFETVIRYLGGLLASYDLSDGKDKILLQKAIQLADNLMGAFDTPNRMPITYFLWMDDDYYNRKYRASADTIFAEVGSLTLEFTRLAQLTGNDSYYDAVARITNEMYEYAPKSKIPWLFPQSVDISGCETSPVIDQVDAPSIDNMNIMKSSEFTTKTGEPEEAVATMTATESNPGHKLNKRAAIDYTKKLLVNANIDSNIDNNYQQDQTPHIVELHMSGGFGKAKPFKMHCLPSGMKDGSRTRPLRYTMGGLTDSSYEYFMKEYQLLSGAEPKYVDLYTNMVDAAKKHLVFKPWVENNHDILFLGSQLSFRDGLKEDNEMTHLACFAGGMFALGGKLLNRPEDVELGKQLTEGCVWSYNSTRSGVMPESFHVRRCPSEGACPNFDFEEMVNNRIGSSGKQMPHTKVIADERSGDRWPVMNFYDQPRSFLRQDPKYIMRPEALESVFYLYRITGDQVWQEKGWTMIESILKLTQIMDENNQVRGYSGVRDVTNDDPLKHNENLADNCESFWMAETLKYAYLLFEDPNVISLDDYVFNTEAHPFKLSK